MDLYCRHCGEPWDHDSLHEEAAARYGAPYYLTEDDRRASRVNPAYDRDAYAEVFNEVSADFRTKGCVALELAFGAKCTTASTSTDSSFGLTRQDAAGALYDLLGDDTDGAAAMLDDLNF